MCEKKKTKPDTTPKVTVDDVNRILEVGRLLRYVLTSEEMEEFQGLLLDTNIAKSEIGNTSVT